METREFTLEELDKIIQDNNPEALLGALETSYFEFREKPYYPENDHDVTSKEKSRLELLKDFSSIANSGGGYIFTGFKPNIDASKFNSEYVEEVKGVNRENIKFQSWLDILSKFLTPSVKSGFLKYGFIGTDKTVFWIKVPNAKEIGCYPFIINKDQWVTEENVLLKGLLLGAYFRDGAKNDHLLSAEKIQSLIADSLNSRENIDSSQRLTAMEAKIDQMLALQDNVSSKTIDLDTKKKEILETIRDRLNQDSDLFYLVAVPERNILIESETFWTKGDSSLHDLIKKPPTFRNMGWDLNTALSEFPEPKGETWESMNGDRKILLVDNRGTVGAGGTIQEFLDWGLNVGNTTGVLNINAFALVEFIASYFNFLSKFTNKFIKSDTEYHIYGGFILRINKKYKLMFAIGEDGKPAFLPSQSKEMQQDDWDFGSFKPLSEINAKQFAAKVVLRIYASGFGFVDENPPYLVKQNDLYFINEEVYKKK